MPKGSMVMLANTSEGRTGLRDVTKREGVVKPVNLSKRRVGSRCQKRTVSQ